MKDKITSGYTKNINYLQFITEKKTIKIPFP